MRHSISRCYNELMKFIKLIIVLPTFLISYLLIINSALAVDCLNINPNTVSSGDADYCMAELDRIKGQYAPAQEKNKQDLAKLQSKLNELNKRITSMTLLLKNLQLDIVKRE